MKGSVNCFITEATEQLAHDIVHDIAEYTEQLAHDHDGYARHLIVYLNRFGDKGPKCKEYLRLFPDHGKITAYSHGTHSEIFPLDREGMQAAMNFMYGNAGEPTVAPQPDENALFLQKVLSMIEQGHHSNNEHHTKQGEKAILEERVA